MPAHPPAFTVVKLLCTRWRWRGFGYMQERERLFAHGVISTPMVCLRVHVCTFPRPLPRDPPRDPPRDQPGWPVASAAPPPSQPPQPAIAPSAAPPTAGPDSSLRPSPPRPPAAIPRTCASLWRAPAACRWPPRRQTRKRRGPAGGLVNPQPRRSTARLGRAPGPLKIYRRRGRERGQRGQRRRWRRR